MSKREEASGRKKIKITQYSNTIFENSDATIPDREPGALLMSFGDVATTTGVLLLPPKPKAPKPTATGVPPQLTVLTGPTAEPPTAAAAFDGVPNVLLPASDFEAKLAASTAASAPKKTG